MFFFFIAAFSSKSVAQDKVAYVEISDGGKTLTFYYDTKKEEKTNTTYGIDEISKFRMNLPAWLNSERDNERNYYKCVFNDYEKVIFDESFDQDRPKSCFIGFYKRFNLTQIIGIEYLHTDEVTNAAENNVLN